MDKALTKQALFKVKYTSETSSQTCVVNTSSFKMTKNKIACRLNSTCAFEVIRMYNVAEEGLRDMDLL